MYKKQRYNKQTYNKGIHNKKRYNQGYTLVEMIVVLAITAIIASITMGGLVMYQRHATFKKNNEYAQTIFSIAQSSLNHAKMSGQLEMFSDMLDTPAYTGNLLPNNIEGGTKVPDATKKTKSLYYLTFKKGEKASAYTGAYKTLYEMIAPYVYDATILDATFCVEFDPIDGLVLGVCYSEKATGFTYEGGKHRATGIVNIRNRTEEARKKTLVGYYGVKELGARAPKKIERSLIAKMDLMNEETLHLRWKLEPDIKEQLEYSVKLFSEDTHKPMLSLELNKTKESTIRAEAIAGKNPTVLCDIQLYDADGKESKKVTGVKFIAYVSAEQEYYLVLDALDTDIDRILKLPETEQDYTKTYSIKRFGVDSEKVYAKLQASGNTYAPEEWKQSNVEQALFAKESGTTDKTYSIANARHLNNIRLLESSKENKKATDVDYTYEQINDFGWFGTNGIVAHRKAFIGQKPIFISPDEGNVGPNSFPTIHQLAVGNSYQGKEKHVFKINNFQIAGEKTTSNLPVGLFGINYGTIQDVEIRNVAVFGEGKDYVGGICGVNSGVLRNLTTSGKIKTQGGAYAGGIAGSDITGRPEIVNGETIIHTGAARVYQNLTNKASVEGKDYTGGIVGYIKGIHTRTDGTNQTLQLAQCENWGDVTGTQYVGGITGYNNTTIIKKCYLKQGTIRGGGTAKAAASTGGIAGYNSGLIEQSGCESVGEKTELTVKLSYGHVGGIVGLNDSDGQVKNCLTGHMWTVKDIEKGMNPGIDSGTGGVIGTNESTKPVTNNTNRGKVRTNGSGTSTVGGIIGLQNSDKGVLSLDSCENYGVLTGAGIAGGIVGRWINGGGTISDCLNHGSIGTIKSGSSGGIVGIVENIRDDSSIVIKNCTNQESITGTGRGTAGILGLTQGSPIVLNRVSVTLDGCVNTGLIDNTLGYGAGILGSPDMPVPTIIRNCRNAGVAPYTQPQKKMSGIVGDGSALKGYVRIMGCYGISDCQYPIAHQEAKESTENYYFIKEQALSDSADAVVVDEIVIQDANGTQLAPRTGKELFDNQPNSIYRYDIPYAKGVSTLTFSFEQPQDLHTLKVWPGVGESYRYKISYIDREFKLHGLTSETGNGQESIMTDLSSFGVTEATGIQLEITPDDIYEGTRITVGEIQLNGRDSAVDATWINKGLGIGLTIDGDSVYKAGNTAQRVYNTVPLTRTPTDIDPENGDAGTCAEVYQAIQDELGVTKVTTREDVKVAKQQDAKLQNTEQQNTEQPSIEQQSTEQQKVLELLKNPRIAAGTIKSPLDHLLWKPEEESEEDMVEEAEDKNQPNHPNQQDKEETSVEHSEMVQDSNQGTTEEPAAPEIVAPPKKMSILSMTEELNTAYGVEQTQLTWNEEAYVQEYQVELMTSLQEKFHLTIIRNASKEKEPFTIVKETNQKNADGTSIYEPCADPDGPVVTSQGGGVTATTFSYPYGYERTISNTVEDITYDTMLVGYVECVKYTKQGVEPWYNICMVLPDVTTTAGLAKVYGTEAQLPEYQYTTEVIITNVVTDATLYEAPNPMKWKRIDASGTTKIEEVK
ncbi:MAG: prepilin-type N-terminal cleavage/methylation domain-containing protein [Lachnospiraceae bacterium]